MFYGFILGMLLHANYKARNPASIGDMLLEPGRTIAIYSDIINSACNVLLGIFILWKLGFISLIYYLIGIGLGSFIHGYLRAVLGYYAVLLSREIGVLAGVFSIVVCVIAYFNI